MFSWMEVARIQAVTPTISQYIRLMVSATARAEPLAFEVSDGYGERFEKWQDGASMPRRRRSMPAAGRG